MTMEIFNEEEKMPSTRQDSNTDGTGGGGKVSEIFLEFKWTLKIPNILRKLDCHRNVDFSLEAFKHTFEIVPFSNFTLFASMPKVNVFYEIFINL